MISVVENSIFFYIIFVYFFINIIKDGKLAKRQSIDIPERIENVIKCKNPRCITTVEQGLNHVFVLSDKENRVYRCLYCESKAK